MDTRSPNPVRSQRDETIAQYQILVNALSRRFAYGSLDREDVVSIGNVGLLKALNAFDPQWMVPFGNYATYIIVGELQHYIRDHGSIIRIPRRLQALSRKVAKAREVLAQELGRMPSLSQVAERMELSERCIDEGDRARAIRTPVSVDRASSQGAYEAIQGMISAHQNGNETKSLERRENICSALDSLDERSGFVLRRYFFDGWSQSRIAKALATSQSNVSRWNRKALSLLARILGAECPHVLPKNEVSVRRHSSKEALPAPYEEEGEWAS